MFGEGISQEGDILDLAVDLNIINKSGAWFAYNGAKIGQGRENAKIYLKEHPEVRDEVEKKVRIHYHLLDGEEPAETADADTPQQMKFSAGTLNAEEE